VRGEGEINFLREASPLLNSPFNPTHDRRRPVSIERLFTPSNLPLFNSSFNPNHKRRRLISLERLFAPILSPFKLPVINIPLV